MGWKSSVLTTMLRIFFENFVILMKNSDLEFQVAPEYDVNYAMGVLNVLVSREVGRLLFIGFMPINLK